MDGLLMWVIFFWNRMLILGVVSVGIGTFSCMMNIPVLGSVFLGMLAGFFWIFPDSDPKYIISPMQGRLLMRFATQGFRDRLVSRQPKTARELHALYDELTSDRREAAEEKRNSEASEKLSSIFKNDGQAKEPK